MPLFFNSKTIADHVSALVESRFRIQEERYTGPLQREIDALSRQLKGSKNIKALSEHPGWREIEDYFSQRALLKLQDLPGNVARQSPEAEGQRLVDSVFIEFTNTLLGLVNETLLESARCNKLINDRIEMQRRYNEENGIVE